MIPDFVHHCQVRLSDISLLSAARTRYISRQYEDMPSKTKILYVITKSSWGGAQRYVFDMASHLPTDRFEVAVAAGGDGPLFERLKQCEVRTIKLESVVRDIGILRDVRACGELIRLFRRERPDIVHLNS